MTRLENPKGFKTPYADATDFCSSASKAKLSAFFVAKSLCELFTRRLVTLEDAMSRSSDVDELKNLINSAGNMPGGATPGPRRRAEVD